MWRLLPLLLGSLACGGSAGAAEQSLRTEDRPPPGFERLEEPQQALVDLYFDGRSHGRVMVTYTPASVRFVQPGLILPEIEPVLDGPAVAALLTREFPHNSKLVCAQGRRPPVCGELATEDMGVIFDESHLRLDLFLSPTLRATADRSRDYLDAGKPSPSLLLAYGGTGSMSLPGRDGSSRDYSTFLQGTGTVGEYHYTARMLSQTGRPLSLDAAALSRDAGDWSYSAGLTDDDTIAPLAGGRLLGVSAETTFNLRANPDLIYGNPVIIFLARPSQVDLLRGTRLLSSRRLEAGRQTLDTADLPEGSYDITIRITDSSGVPREEHRFFVKSRAFAPAGQPYLHFDFGRRLAYDSASLQSVAGPLVAHAAARFRADDWLSLGSDAFSYGPVFFGGPTVDAVLGESRFGVHGLQSIRGDRALTAYVLQQADPFFLHADINAMFSGLRDHAARSLDPLDPVGAGFKQATLGLDYLGDRLSVGVTGGFRSQQGISQTTITPYLRLPLIQEGENNVTLGVEATRIGSQTLVLLQLSLYRQPVTSHYTYSGNAGYRVGNQRASPDLSATADWQDPDSVGEELRLQARTQRSLDDDIAGLEAEYRGPEGRFKSYLQGTQPASGSFGAIGGLEVDGNLAIGNGVVAPGGADTQTSAVIVTIEGGVPGTRFSVLINGNPMGFAVAGQSTPVPLAPYRTYLVSLRPPTDELLSLTTRSERVTLLPGMVKRVVWSVDAIKVVVAQIVDAAGRPVEQARIEGATGPAASGEEGWVQMEVKSGALLKVSDKDGQALCSIELPALTPDKMFVALGQLTCRP